MLLSLPQIEDKIRECTAVIDTPEEFIPTFGFSNQTGLSHIEILDRHYHLVVCENGKELSRETFDNTDELVFKVLEDISFSMACDRVFEGLQNKTYQERFIKAQNDIISKITSFYSNKAKQRTLFTKKNSALGESRKKTLRTRKKHRAIV